MRCTSMTGRISALAVLLAVLAAFAGCGHNYQNPVAPPVDNGGGGGGGNGGGGGGGGNPCTTCNPDTLFELSGNHYWKSRSNDDGTAKLAVRIDSTTCGMSPTTRFSVKVTGLSSNATPAFDVQNSGWEYCADGVHLAAVFTIPAGTRSAGRSTLMIDGNCWPWMNENDWSFTPNPSGYKIPFEQFTRQDNNPPPSSFTDLLDPNDHVKGVAINDQHDAFLDGNNNVLWFYWNPSEVSWVTPFSGRMDDYIVQLANLTAWYPTDQIGTMVNSSTVQFTIPKGFIVSTNCRVYLLVRKKGDPTGAVQGWVYVWQGSPYYFNDGGKLGYKTGFDAAGVIHGGWTSSASNYEPSRAPTFDRIAALYR